MPQFLLTDATVVAPDRVIYGGTVVVEDGTIAEVQERTFAADRGDRSLSGRYLLPGFVDLHNDTLDREVTPRAITTALDPDYAMAQYDRRLAAAGVTTEFHGVSFIEHPREPWRTLAFAARLVRAVRTLRCAPYATIDHHILYRLELRTEGALDAVLEALDCVPAPLMTCALHNIGEQRPLALETFRPFFRRTHAAGQGMDGAAGVLAPPEEYAAGTEEATIVDNLARGLVVCASRDLILASHDDDTPDKVDMVADLGFRVAEFPMTSAAAERAHERGMRVVVGAPNALRGRSKQGGVSVQELVTRGLADILVADYHAPALIGAVFRLATEGFATLPSAVAMAATNPAQTVGMTDRGAIAPGYRADLVVASLHGAIPVVDATFAHGRLAYSGGYER